MILYKFYCFCGIKQLSLHKINIWMLYVENIAVSTMIDQNA